MARAGARITGIDLTAAAVERTQRRFALRGLEGDFQQWDAELPRADFVGRFDYVWSWGVIHHSARTARIVRNVEQWVTESGVFAGMVYHRDSTSAAVAILRSWFYGRAFTQSIDEALWRSTDGFTARFYPADQWRDLLLGFFADASVEVTGNEPDAVPLPRALRVVVARLIPARIRDRIIARAGSFVLFEAQKPLRAVREDRDAESTGLT
jgi:SAM-dependent methyltransferase